ncbi:hypothetical protein [Virgibacillus halodenitrificans]|uniref:hypothetical protein n=1 Tax=Virgibacillus halodenitrificans TaxID=1482 RepID=UPI000EF4595E|nr:hypothetical protein [Virgibacillus halodenitrificans]
MLNKFKRHSFLYIIAVFILFSFVNSNYTNPVNAKEGTDVKTEKTQAATEVSSKEISQREITDITSRFIEILIQKADENYKVKKYQTKTDLLHAFEEVTTNDVAQPYVDFYYEEKNDGLYILPTETPAWFVEENAYDIIQMEGNKVKVIQENNSPLHGKYHIEIEFTFQKEWKITDIKYL